MPSNSVYTNKQLLIPVGGMYEEWGCMMDLVDEVASKRLMVLAQKGEWCEVRRDELIDCGFDELLDWSMPESDVLVLIDDKYLVCLNKNDYQLSQV